MSKWNALCDCSTYPVPIDKTLVKKIKFAENPSTEVKLKNNFYDPRATNEKYYDNHSMNTLKGDLEKCLPSSGCSKNSEKKSLNVKLLNLIMRIKQIMTLTLKWKLLIIFPCLLKNFTKFNKILSLIWLINTLSIFC